MNQAAPAPQSAPTPRIARRDETTATAAARWPRWIGQAAALVLGAVLLVAAWAKLLDPAAFADTIHAEGLDGLLPGTAVALIAIGLEVALGVALVLGLRQRWVLWPSTALVAFFVLLTARSYLRASSGTPGAEAGCGCFGNLIERTPAEAFWQDLLLLVPPLALAFLGRPRATRQPRLRSACVLLLTAGALLIAWKAPELPLDNLATRLKPGVSIRDLCAGTGETRTCLDSVLPELTVDEHLVLLTGLDEAPFLDALDALNERQWAGTEPPLWVLTAASDDARFRFQFTHGPAFTISAAPAALLRPLYRRLPRAFRVRDGRVRETWSGLPPLGPRAED